MHHPNEKLMRDLDEAQLKGDVDTFANAFADDVVVHVPGKSSLAGDYKGKDRCLDLFQRFDDLVPDFSFEPHAYLADDEHGVVLQKSSYKRDGQTLDTNEVFTFHFQDGKISELWIMSQKSDEVDAFLG